MGWGVGWGGGCRIPRPQTGQETCCGVGSACLQPVCRDSFFLSDSRARGGAPSLGVMSSQVARARARGRRRRRRRAFNQRSYEASQLAVAWLGVMFHNYSFIGGYDENRSNRKVVPSSRSLRVTSRSNRNEYRWPDRFSENRSDIQHACRTNNKRKSLRHSTYLFNMPVQHATKENRSDIPHACSTCMLQHIHRLLEFVRCVIV